MLFTIDKTSEGVYNVAVLIQIVRTVQVERSGDLSLINVDPRSRVPIYEQIVASVKDLVFSGELSADSPLPSVRSLASELAINPNTIQRAYAMLEAENIIYSLPARGSFISPDTGNVINARKEQLFGRLTDDIRALKRLGVSSDEVKVRMDLAWR